MQVHKYATGDYYVYQTADHPVHDIQITGPQERFALSSERSAQITSAVAVYHGEGKNPSPEDVMTEIRTGDHENDTIKKEEIGAIRSRVNRMNGRRIREESQTAKLGTMEGLKDYAGQIEESFSRKDESDRPLFLFPVVPGQPTMFPVVVTTKRLLRHFKDANVVGIDYTYGIVSRDKKKVLNVCVQDANSKILHIATCFTDDEKILTQVTVIKALQAESGWADGFKFRYLSTDSFRGCDTVADACGFVRRSCFFHVSQAGRKALPRNLESEVALFIERLHAAPLVCMFNQLTFEFCRKFDIPILPVMFGGRQRGVNQNAPHQNAPRIPANLPVLMEETPEVDDADRPEDDQSSSEEEDPTVRPRLTRAQKFVKNYLLNPDARSFSVSSACNVSSHNIYTNNVCESSHSRYKDRLRSLGSRDLPLPWCEVLRLTAKFFVDVSVRSREGCDKFPRFTRPLTTEGYRAAHELASSFIVESYEASSSEFVLYVPDSMLSSPIYARRMYPADGLADWMELNYVIFLGVNIDDSKCSCPDFTSKNGCLHPLAVWVCPYSHIIPTCSFLLGVTSPVRYERSPPWKDCGP